MELKQITTQKELNSFVIRAAGGQFLQSWEWGEFQKGRGNNIWRYGIWQDELLACATIVENKLPLSRSYLYCPYGPVFKPGVSDIQKEKIIKLLLAKGRDITIDTKTRSEIFFRIEPRLTKIDLGNFFFNMGLINTDAIQPRDTQLIDLGLSEFRLLKNMHQKTRYNIRLAEKKEVKVRIGKNAKDLDIFWILMKITTRRDNFHSHSKDYYQKMFLDYVHTDINNQGQLTIKLLIAEKDNKPLAVGLFSFFGDRVMYLHGASSDEQRNLMAPHLLQWQAIKLSKENGYQFFDFNGIAPAQRKIELTDKESKWQGITRFKKSFGGEEVNYTGAWDWVYDKMWYKVYKIGRKIL